MNKLNKSSLIKLAVIALVVLAVTAVWVIKNRAEAPPPEGGDQGEYVLEVAAFDLEAYFSTGLPVMLAFGADGCAPCRAMLPDLKAVHLELQGKAVIKFIDAWKQTEEVREYPLQVVPTQIFFTADGKPYEPSEELGIEFISYTFRETGEPAYTVHEGGLTADQMRAIFADMGVSQ